MGAIRFDSIIYLGRHSRPDDAIQMSSQRHGSDLFRSFVRSRILTFVRL